METAIADNNVNPVSISNLICILANAMDCSRMIASLACACSGRSGPERAGPVTSQPLALQGDNQTGYAGLQSRDRQRSRFSNNHNTAAFKRPKKYLKV
jgi:hypothetical protein